MVHEARIIPLDGRPHTPSPITSYLGDSRGHWEGDTLVVETTNFRRNVDETSYNCCGGAAENLSIVERLTLVGNDAIDYRYTVNDPTIFTRPWTVSLPMRRVVRSDLRVRLPRRQRRHGRHSARRPRRGPPSHAERNREVVFGPGRPSGVPEFRIAQREQREPAAESLAILLVHLSPQPRGPRT